MSNEETRFAKIRKALQRASQRGPFDLDEELGEGAYKKAYAVKGVDAVALVPHDHRHLQVLRTEASLLRKMRKMGVPTVPCFGFFRVRSPETGRLRQAMMLPKMAAATRDDDHRSYNNLPRPFRKCISRRSLASLNRIEKALDRVPTTDWQFLISRTGEIWFHDPLPGQWPKGAVEAGRNEILYWIEDVRRIAKKRT